MLATLSLLLSPSPLPPLPPSLPLLHIVKFALPLSLSAMETLHPAVWEQIKDLPFYLCHVTLPFNPFSQVDLALEAYETPLKEIIVVRTRQLFQFDEELLLTPDKRPENVNKAFTSLLSFLERCRSTPWPPSHAKPYKEVEQFLDIATHLLYPLCSEVILENRYRTKLGCGNTFLTTAPIGIGSVDTWHGSPDARVRECPVLLSHACSPTEEDGDGEEPAEGSKYGSEEGASTSEESEGTPTPVEAKQRCSTWEHGPQVVSICVTSSFTEHTLHPKKNPCVPTILIDLHTISVCLYDCQHDVLLMSAAKPLSSRGFISRSGSLLLWLTLNHRYRRNT